MGFIEITAMRHRRALSKYPLDNFCPRRDDDVYERDVGLYGSVLKERWWVLLKRPRCDIDGVLKRPRCDTNGESETEVITQ